MAKLGANVLRWTVFAAGYVVAGALSLRLGVGPSAIGPLWAPAGLAAAILITQGLRVWPVVFLCSLLVHTTVMPLWPGVFVAASDTIQAVLAARLVNQFAGGRDLFRRAPFVLRFATLIAPAIAIVGGTLSTVVAHFLIPHVAVDVTAWLAACLAQLIGMLVFTPLAALWSMGPWRRSWSQLAEFATLLMLLVAACLAVFAGVTPFADRHHPLQIVCVPFLMWAAFRHGRREAATVVAIITGIAAFGTQIGAGPFARGTAVESILWLQLYAGIWSVMTMSLAAVVSEHAHAERLATALSITDPLTGLANYRELTRDLEAEIARSDRTHRSFALLFVDVDGLKQINDTLGHLAGNQALRRVARAIQHSCRAVDTPARFGGDEFVIVLPETDAIQAQTVARRVAHAVAEDPEQPPLSVSTGIAAYPRDGVTAALLLTAADAILYRSKALRHGPVRKPAAGE